MPLPRLPEIRLEVVDDRSPSQPKGWLRLVRRVLRAHYPDGQVSRTFEYDAIHRAGLDASIIVAHYRDADHRRHVYLRSAVRPALLLRESWRDPTPDPTVGLWELPAGIVDPQDYRSPDAPRVTAQRELEEELGFRAELDAVHALGPSVLPVPGVIAEKHHFYEVEVDPSQRGEPGLDGSALERGGLVIAVELGRALALCACGEILDSKTELGLRRLEEQLR